MTIFYQNGATIYLPKQDISRIITDTEIILRRYGKLIYFMKPHEIVKMITKSNIRFDYFNAEIRVFKK